ncbi:uncharacterized protein LOC143938994 isoform X2 [Lithobates pipiens]
MKETHQRVKKPLRQQDMDIRHFVSKKGSNAAEGAEPESHDEAVSTDQLSECDDSILLAEEGTSSTTTDTEKLQIVVNQNRNGKDQAMTTSTTVKLGNFSILVICNSILNFDLCYRLEFIE